MNLLMHGTDSIVSGAFAVSAEGKPGLSCIRHTDTGTAFPFPETREPASVWTVLDPGNGQLTEIPDSDERVSCVRETAADGIRWRMTFAGSDRMADAPVLEACILLRMEQANIRITLTDVRETAEAHLVMVRLNRLVGISDQDPSARLAMPAHGGRLLDPAVCAEGQTDHRYNWILDSFGAAAIAFTERMTCVARIHSMDDQLTSRVEDFLGVRSAQIGVLLRRRYTDHDVSYRKAKPARDPSRREDAEALPVSRDFLVQEAPYVTLHLMAHASVSPECGWTVGAQYIRDHLPDKRTDYYRDRMVYKIFVGAPGQEPATRLCEIRNVIEQFAARTENAGQIPYLVGFQHGGHDSLYPDVFTLNPVLESMEALKKLAEDAEKLNCRLSFHDNYDDAYAESPSWCAEDISRDHEGHLLRGGVWNGVQAYWNSMPYYAVHRAQERIRKTLKMYPFLKETYHLDVLTASVFRVDFREEQPTGRQDDLKARLEIVRMFRAMGLDVSSEACGLPFVGEISYFWHMQRIPRPLYEGDVRIPMVPFLVHGKADYAGTHSDTMRNILDGLLYGAFYCNDVTAKTPVKELTDAYYMLQVPLNLLRNEKAVAYESDHGWKKVVYESGSTVEVHFEEEACRVTIGGQRIIENGTAMLPQTNGDTILYRCQEEPYEDVKWHTGMPAGTQLTAEPIGTQDAVRMLTVDETGCIPVDTVPGVAYRVRKTSL